MLVNHDDNMDTGRLFTRRIENIVTLCNLFAYPITKCRRYVDKPPLSSKHVTSILVMNQGLKRPSNYHKVFARWFVW